MKNHRHLHYRALTLDVRKIISLLNKQNMICGQDPLLLMKMKMAILYVQDTMMTPTGERY
jgi:hypothetical protein